VRYLFLEVFIPFVRDVDIGLFLSPGCLSLVRSFFISLTPLSLFISFYLSIFMYFFISFFLSFFSSIGLYFFISVSRSLCLYVFI